MALVICRVLITLRIRRRMSRILGISQLAVASTQLAVKNFVIPSEAKDLCTSLCPRLVPSVPEYLPWPLKFPLPNYKSLARKRNILAVLAQHPRKPGAIYQQTAFLKRIDVLEGLVDNLTFLCKPLREEGSNRIFSRDRLLSIRQYHGIVRIHADQCVHISRLRSIG